MEIGPTKRIILGSAVILCALLFFRPAWAVRGEVAAIHLYQKVGSPLAATISTCRFQPTCSEYALQSLENHGFWEGNLRIATRLLHCSPFGYAWDALAR